MASARTALHDVVVSGGGVVGSLLGCLLADSPRLSRLSLALVEPSPPPPLAAAAAPGRAPSGRTYAISPASARLLAQAGVWDAVTATGRAQPYAGMHVWDALGPGRISFGRAGSGGGGGEALGYMVEHEVLAGALWERLQGHAASGRVAVYAGARMASLALPPAPLEAAWPGWGGAPAPAPGDLAALALTDAQVLRCRLVVAADGAASPVRAAAGVGVAALDYGQHALCATVRLGGGAEGARGTAWQRFLPLGPVAVLPLWGDYASVVWSTSPAHARALAAMEPRHFTAALNAVLHASEADFHAAAAGAAAGSSGSSSDDGSSSSLRPPVIASLLAPPSSHPLRLALAQGFTRSRLALVGDAAHTVHPLAGQGLNQGLRDARDLCAALASVCGGQGEEAGSGSVLAHYASAAQPRNAGVALGIHCLQRLFAGRGGGAGAGRAPCRPGRLRACGGRAACCRACALQAWRWPARARWRRPLRGWRAQTAAAAAAAAVAAAVAAAALPRLPQGEANRE